VAVSPELPEHLREIRGARGLTLDILHDPGGEVASAYGLTFTLPEDLQAVYTGFGLDLPTLNGDGAWTLPLPARYIVDAGGSVRYARIHADYTTRPEPEDTLEALRALAWMSVVNPTS